jgi:hypothetical protein
MTTPTPNPPRPTPRHRGTPARGRAFRAADGRAFRLRAIHPGDVPALQRAFARLTPEQIRHRTFHHMNELTTDAATRLANVAPRTARRMSSSTTKARSAARRVSTSTLESRAPSSR